MIESSIFEICEEEQGSDPWLAARHGLVTASKAHRFANGSGGLSGGAEAIAVELVMESYCQMLNRFGEHSGLPCDCDWNEFGGSRDTDRGNEDEPHAIKAFEEEEKLDVARVGLCRHRNNGLLGFSPDGLIEKGGEWWAGVEVKCPRKPNHAKTLLHSEMPDKHAAQVHFSMAVSGIPRWYFVSYFFDRPPFIQLIEADEQTDLMVQSIEKFASYLSRVRKAIVGKF